MWVPLAAMRPFSTTRIWSAFWTVARRCVQDSFKGLGEFPGVVIADLAANLRDAQRQLRRQEFCGEVHAVLRQPGADGGAVDGAEAVFHRRHGDIKLTRERLLGEMLRKVRCEKVPAVFTEQPGIYQIARKFTSCQTGDAGSDLPKRARGCIIRA